MALPSTITDELLDRLTSRVSGSTDNTWKLTEVYTGESWHAPVKKKADLPTGDAAKEGMMCYGREDSSAYVFRNGEWKVEITKNG